MTYDSRPDTGAHSYRVEELLQPLIRELSARSSSHDFSKLKSPEVEIFDEFTPKLKHSTYGSEEYKGFLESMGEALKHHYEVNRHHPEHFENGINDMTLIDLVEMLADWKAATERHEDGSLIKSLDIQRDRFGIDDQLMGVLYNTAREYGWLDVEETPDRAGVLIEALDAGVVTRRWVCTSDKSDCTPENKSQMGYLHYSCHWYWSVWTVVQDEIESIYQQALNR